MQNSLPLTSNTFGYNNMICTNLKITPLTTYTKLPKFGQVHVIVKATNYVLLANLLYASNACL